MKPSSIAIGAVLVVVAVAAFLLGRSTPRHIPIPTPETGGKPAPGPSGPAPAAASAKPDVAAPAPSKGSIERVHAPRTDSSPSATETFESKELKVAVTKPRGEDWQLIDNPGRFMPSFEGKVVEIRRVPRSANGKMASIDLFVLKIPPAETADQAFERIERLGERGKFGQFTALEEGPVDIGGRSFTRRLSAWKRKDKFNYLGKGTETVLETRFLSVRAVADGKLYVLIGWAFAEDMDALLSDFQQVAQSLRIG